MSKYKYIISIVVLGTGLAILAWHPRPIQFEQFKGADFTGQLTPLFLVALVIERSLEVFISTWRGGGELKLQAAVDRCKKAADADANNAAKLAELHTAEDNLANFKSSTQQIAMPSALVLGILVSALGVRCLGNFVVADAFKDHPTQQAWFTVADVMLTGGLLGGGSDFIHQFISAFTDFVNKPTKS